MGIYINGLGAGMYAGVTGRNRNVGQSSAGIVETMGSVVTENVATRITSVVDTWSCLPPDPAPPPEVPVESEAQEDSEVPPRQSYPVRSRFFLAPTRVLDRPTTSLSRRKTVVDQSVFIARGRDTSVLVPGIERAASIAYNLPIVRYPEQANDHVSLESQRDMDALRYVMGSVWTLTQTDYAMVSDTYLHLPLSEAGTVPNYMFDFQYHDYGSVDPTRFTISLTPKWEQFFIPGTNEMTAEYGRGERASLANYIMGDLLVPEGEENTQQIRYRNRYSRGIIDGVMYSDYVHELDMPLFSSEKGKANIPGRILDASIKMEYNYVTAQYKRISNPTEISNPYRVCNSDENRITLRDGIYYSTPRNDEQLAFTPHHMKDFDKVYEEYRKDYPMVTVLDFATTQGTSLSRIFSNQSSVVKSIAISMLDNPGEVRSFAQVMSETIEDSESFDSNSSIRMENDKFVQEQGLEVHNAIDLITFSHRDRISLNQFPMHRRSRNDGDPDNPDDALSALLERLERAATISKIKELESSKSRSFRDILSGVKSYSEPVAYFVEKVNGSGQIIQSYLFMDNDEIDRIRFIDPQLVYQEEYTYRVYVVNLVIGNEYIYEELRFDSPSVPHFASEARMASVFYYDNGDLTQRYEGDHDIGFSVVERTTAKAAPAPEPMLTSFDVDPPPKYEKSPTQNLDDFGTAQIVVTAEGLRNEDELAALMRADQEPTNIAVPVIWTTEPTNPSAPTEEEIMREIRHRRETVAKTTLAANLYYGYGHLLNLQRDDAQGSALRASDVHDLMHIEGSCFPRARLIKVPYFEKTIYVDDCPPLSPDVDIVPFKGILDSVRITLSSRVGEEMSVPILLDDADDQRFEGPRRSQNVDSGAPIKFMTDDPPATYEVYRVTERPGSYREFSGKLHATVTNDDFSQSGVALSSAVSMVDNVIPNTKYYYMFRSIDSGGHVSNPSKVYCVQLVSTDDGMYLDWFIQEFPKIAKVTSIPVSSVFSIRSSEVQRSPDLTGQTPDGDDSFRPPLTLFPGPVNDRVWGRKFVVRVKSKSCKNAVDIRFTCVNSAIDERTGTPGVRYKNTRPLDDLPPGIY